MSGLSRPGHRPRNLPFLDGLRGFAALYVMVFHARWLLWEGFVSGYLQHPDAYPLPAKVVAHIFLFFSYGGQVVLLFFVLSGFVIHLPQALKHAQGDTSASLGWRTYFKRRALRIYPPLIFALALTFVVDRAGMAAGLPVYSAPTILNLDIRPAHDLGTLMGNLTFTMTVYVPSFGTNAVLWSLMYEWWFYMLYPLFWWIGRRSFGLATGLLVGLYVLSFFPQLWPVALARAVFSKMIFWWLGVILAEVYARRLHLRLWHIAPLGLLFLPLVPVEFLLPPQTEALRSLTELAWSAAFAGLIAALLAWRNRGGSLRAVEALRRLAPFSYTLYVTHFPILLFLCGWLLVRSPGGRLPMGVGWALLGAAICIVVAYAAHFVVERPFLSRRKLHQASAALMTGTTPPSTG